MVKELFVYFNNEKVGILREIKGILNFEYIDDKAKQISFILPNKNILYKNNVCQKFFSNLLPEGNLREHIAKFYNIKEQIFPLLEKIGGECAGAISFYNNINIKENDKELQEITFDNFLQIMKNLKKIPLGIALNNRLSLAGIQEKFSLYIPYEILDINNINLQNCKFYQANNNFPSNFIIKQNIENLKDTVYNELFCMLLAKELDFFVPNVFLLDNKYLFIERFDRQIKNTNIIRTHQEDFNQLSLNFPEKKYEKDGGCSIRQCINLIDKYCHIDDSKERFLKLIIFNYFIGNCDAHGKNFSLLYDTLIKQDTTNNIHHGNFKKIEKENYYTLSPVYDLLSTEIYEDLDKELAMQISGEYNIEKIQLFHFIKLANNIDINKQYFLNLINNIKDKILEKALNLKNKLEKQDIKSEVFNEIITLIKNKIEKLN